MCQAVNHQIYTDDDDDDDDEVDVDDDDDRVAGTYRPEAGALEETMARSEGGRNNEVMLISVQTFNFVIWPESLVRHATKHHLLPELPLLLLPPAAPKRGNLEENDKGDSIKKAFFEVKWQKRQQCW